MNLGDATDNPEAAIALLEQALRDAPTQDVTANQWVKLLDRTGDVQRKAVALTAHIERLECCADATEAQRAQAYRWLAAALAQVEPREVGELSAAISAYETSVALDPEAETLELLAALYERRNGEGDREQAADILTSVGEALGGGEAIHRAQRALDLVADHTEAMALLEQSMPVSDHSRLLCHRLEQYIALAGTDDDADPRRVRLALVYGELGRIQDALDCLVPAMEHGCAEAISTRDCLLRLQEGTPFADRGESTLVGVPLQSDDDVPNEPSSAEPRSVQPVSVEPGPMKPGAFPIAALTRATSGGVASGATAVGVANGATPVGVAGPVASPEAEVRWPPVSPASAPPPTLAQSSIIPQSPESLYPSGDLTPAPSTAPVARWRVGAMAMVALVSTATAVATWPESSIPQPAVEASTLLPAIATTRLAAAPSVESKPSSTKGIASNLDGTKAERVAPLSPELSSARLSKPLSWRVLRAGVKISGEPIPRGRLFAALKRQKTSVLGCYEEARKLKPALEGQIILSLNLYKTGQPRATVLKSGSIQEAAMGRCVARVLNGARLPRPKRTKTRVRLPLAFVGPK